MSTLDSDVHPTYSYSPFTSRNGSISTLQPRSKEFFPSQPYAQHGDHSVLPSYLEGSAIAQAFQYQQIGPIPTHLQISEELGYGPRFEHFPQPSPQNDLDKLLRLRDEIESGRHPDFPLASHRLGNSVSGVNATDGSDARIRKVTQGLPQEDPLPYFDEEMTSQLPLLSSSSIEIVQSPTFLTPGATSLPSSLAKPDDAKVSFTASTSTLRITAAPLEAAQKSKDQLAKALQAKKELERREEELRQRIKLGSPAPKSQAVQSLPSGSVPLKITSRSNAKTPTGEPSAKRQKRGNRGVPSPDFAKEISPALKQSGPPSAAIESGDVIIMTVPTAKTSSPARKVEVIALDDDLCISSNPTLKSTSTVLPSRHKTLLPTGKLSGLSSSSLPVGEVVLRGSSPQEALQITPAVPAIKSAPFIPLKVIAGADDRWAATKSTATKASASSKSSPLERARTTPRSEDRWAKPARTIPERKVESRLEDRRGRALSPMYRPLSADFDDRFVHSIVNDCWDTLISLFVIEENAFALVLLLRLFCVWRHIRMIDTQHKVNSDREIASVHLQCEMSSMIVASPENQQDLHRSGTIDLLCSPGSKATGWIEMREIIEDRWMTDHRTTFDDPSTIGNPTRTDHSSRIFVHGLLFVMAVEVILRK